MAKKSFEKSFESLSKDFCVFLAVDLVVVAAVEPALR
jgi:hypothetical protein